MTPIYLGLGTNVGNRVANLRQAVAEIGRIPTLTLTHTASIYETPPWGLTTQPPFLNSCVAAETTLAPDDLLRALKQIEQRMGREKTIHWGPRLIDIDILFYGERVYQSDDLTLPHPRIAERAFVLVPLAEIGLNLIHPQTKQTVQTMLNNIESTEISKHPSSLLSPAFEWGKRTYVMGILNVTPDSFSGDGIDAEDQEHNVITAAIAQTKQFIEWGADIIDVGGESTRPGGEVTTAAMEQDRVLPVIEAIRPLCTAHEIPISIDTYRAETAKLALEMGANWVNDIWGLKHDPEMAGVVAMYDCPVVMMHNGRNRPRQEKEDGAGGYYGYYHYDELLAEVKQELQESIDLALNAGVRPEQLILDPGIGFGKTLPQNVTLVNRLDMLKSLGYPLLLGTSRKGFIGHLLGGLPAAERVEGTAATVAIGIDRGADIIRVHDVKEMVRVARMSDALVR